MDTDLYGRPVNIDTYVQELHDAFNAEKHDEETIIRILSKTKRETRQKIRKRYKELYGIPIQKALKDELSYKFKELCLALFDEIYEFDARELRLALHMFLNDDKVICEIFSSRTKEQMEFVDRSYQRFYGMSLRDDIYNETSKDYGAYLLETMNTKRPEGVTISNNEALAIARDLKETGLKEYSKNINKFREVFLEKSREDLVKICRAFNQLFKKTLYQEIRDEAPKKFRKLMKAILFTQISPAEYFSKKVFKAVRGAGTDIRQITRALIFCEDYLDDLRYFYKEFKHVEMKQDILDDTRGSYGKLLANLSEN